MIKLIENSGIEFQGSLDAFDLKEIEHYQKRILIINSTIESEVADGITREILDINSDDKDVPVEKRKPITLFCNSEGGSVVDGFRIIDAILLSKTPVITINLGYQYSMGFLIGIAGHKRYGSINSTYLLHDGSNMVWDSGGKVKDQLKFTERREQRLKEYVIEHTNITAKEYDKNYRIEWYMFADEAKEKGVIDGIIGEDIDLEELL